MDDLSFLPVVEEVGTACFDWMGFGVFDLFPTKFDLSLFLHSPFVSRKRRSSSLAPVIFHGCNQQRQAAE